MSLTCKVPQLRFKEFSGEWEEKKLGELADITTGNKDTQNKVDDGIYPFFVRSQTVEKINSYSYDGEAILTSGDGVGVGKNFHYIQSKFDFHQRVYCIYKFKNKVFGKFIFHYFSEKFHKRVMRLSAKNSVDSVRRDMITEMGIYTPTFNEQQKIASFLSAVDTKIDQLTRKKELLKQYKKGVMQKIFSQEIRFKAYDGSEFSEWDEKSIANCITESKVKGDTGDKAKKLTVKLWNKGVFAKNEIMNGSENTQYYIRKAGQFIYSKLDFLNCAFGIIPEDLDGYQSTIDLPCFDFINSTNPIFFLSRVSRKDFYLQFGEQADGSRKARRINQNIFLEMPILLPSADEQTKIANFLSSLDEKLLHVSQQLDSTKQFKKALLQQMFV